MKSNKQRRKEIKTRRLKRAEKLKEQLKYPNKYDPRRLVGIVEADHNELSHNNTYGPLPDYYIDLAFTCRDCGSEEVWTAKQQKWWYEIAKGDINTTAIRCRPCRKKEQARKAEARRIHLEGLARKEDKSS